MRRQPTRTFASQPTPWRPDKPTNAPQSKIDWTAELEPRGTQTRLGEALDDQLYRYREAPLAGVIVISDGVQNAGIEPSAAIEAAREAGVPVYTIGVGSTEPRRNLAVSDLVVPTRAFPGRHGATSPATCRRLATRADLSTSSCCAARTKTSRRRHADRLRSECKSGPTAKSSRCRSRSSRSAGQVRLPDSSRRAAGRRQSARQRPRSGNRRRRPTDARAAVRQRPDARLPFPPQSTAPRPAR